MNPQIKQKWVDALRSGDYQQGRNYLRTDNGFCCLGVLCDLYGKENNVEWNLAVAEDGDRDYYEFQDKTGRIPLSVVEWAGVEDCNPYICGRSLAERNDTGSTFNEIADLIQEHLQNWHKTLDIPPKLWYDTQVINEKISQQHKTLSL